MFEEGNIWRFLAETREKHPKPSILDVFFNSKNEIWNIMGEDGFYFCDAWPKGSLDYDNSKLSKNVEYCRKRILGMDNEEFIDFHFKQNYNPSVREMTSIMYMLTPLSDDLNLTPEVANGVWDEIDRKYSSGSLQDFPLRVYKVIYMKFMKTAKIGSFNSQTVGMWIEAIDDLINLCKKIQAYKDELRELRPNKKYLECISEIQIQTNDLQKKKRAFQFINRMSMLNGLKIDGNVEDLLKNPLLFPKSVNSLEICNAKHTVVLSNDLYRHLIHLAEIKIYNVEKVKIENNFKSLYCLVKVGIHNCPIIEGIENIDSLYLLSYLEFSQCNFKYFVPKNLPRLQNLVIRGNHEFECLNLGSENSQSMRDLNDLILENCHGIRMVPSELKRFDQLRKLTLTSINLEVGRLSVYNEKKGCCEEIKDISEFCLCDTLAELVVSVKSRSDCKVPWIKNCSAVYSPFLLSECVRYPIDGSILQKENNAIRKDIKGILSWWNCTVS